ncbi:MAG: DUF1952 domain-containing protein [Mogibacterium sp.]|nr:DUF1952 domain-containing protein [Mogibacterium sp.]
MTYDEKWSYPYEQVENYILTCGAIKTGSTYTLPECIVVLEALPPRLIGHLEFPSTRVLIDGPGADEFYKGFFLNFLSGGA